MKPYIEDIIDHFYTLPYAEIDPATLHQVRRSFLDYYGCALYTANAACCKELVALLLDLGAQGNYPIWGESRRGNVVSAAAANACRISNIEMDDGSGWFQKTGCTARQYSSNRLESSQYKAVRSTIPLCCCAVSQSCLPHAA